MILKPSLIAVVVSFAFAGTAWGQAPATLKDAVEQAVLKNPEAKLKNENFLAASSEQEASKGGWRPRVDLNLSGGRNNTSAPSIDSSDYNHSQGAIQLRQTLFDGHATSNDVRRLGHGRMAAYFDLISASDQIALETVRAYLDVLRYRELVTLAQANFATHNDVYNRLISRTNAGVGRRVDLEQAAGRMALAESNWLTEVSNLHDVSARYQRLVGDMPATALTPAPALSKYLPAREGFVANTVKKNPDFLSAVSNIRAYRADAALRKSSYWPTLELRASQGLERNRSGVQGDYRDRSIELVMNYNLYRGGSDSARVQQYAAKLNAAYDLRDKQCRDIRQTSLIALNDVTRLDSQRGFLAQHELSTAKAREAYRQQFDIGQRSLLDLLDTENELYQARRALINAESDLQLAQARVLTANGSLLQALELRPLQSEAPPQPDGSSEDDDALLCNMDMPEVMVLVKPDLPKASNTTPEPVKTLTLPVATQLPTLATAENSCHEITPMIQSWITAWNNKDIKTYLAAYSDAFVPAMNLTRPKWEALRKKRVGKQGGITATLTNIAAPQKCDSNKAEVSFSQEYGSDDYRDAVDKTLALEFVNGQWKILREKVTKGRTF
jgi:adhesin transport system outer membrane protein